MDLATPSRLGPHLPPHSLWPQVSVWQDKEEPADSRGVRQCNPALPAVHTGPRQTLLTCSWRHSS